MKSPLLITTLILGSFVLAGCGGGSGDSKRLTEAEEQISETEKELAEAKKKTEAAEAARQRAEVARQAAEAARQREQTAREQAERERDEQRAEADAAQLALNRDLARDVDRGLRAVTADQPIVAGAIDAIDIAPRYRASATVGTTPAISQRTTATGSLGGWFKTSTSGRDEANLDQLDVYSNVEAPTPVPFKDSDYNMDSNNVIVDAEGDVVSAHTIVPADGEHTEASAFPRTSGMPTGFSLPHRGLLESAYSVLGLNADGTADEEALKDAGITRAQYNQYRNDRGFRNEAIHPFRYTYTTSGTLQGASGTYRCGAASGTGASPCTVQNRGEHFVFAGPWTFRPTSGTTAVRVPDAQFMYFGWWSRQGRLAMEDDWKFQTFHGPTADKMTAVAGLSGPATYRGPAAGFYALNEEHPDVPSAFGQFTATATLQADFGASDADGATVGGTIDDFSGQPDWSLTLQPTAFASDTFTGGGVTWSIGNRDRDGGAWQADFFSDLSGTDRANTVPSGIAGTFNAQFSDVGSMIGAFGAEKQ